MTSTTATVSPAALSRARPALRLGAGPRNVQHNLELEQRRTCGHRVRVLAGVCLAVILIFVINRQVFGWTLQMTMPVPFASAALVLLVLATVLASLQPARRAARVHLTEAVQYE